MTQRTAKEWADKAVASFKSFTEPDFRTRPFPIYWEQQLQIEISAVLESHSSSLQTRLREVEAELEAVRKENAGLRSLAKTQEETK